MLNKEKIFISGAAGVIGKEMLIQLGLRPEVDVLAADRKDKPFDLAKNIIYRQGDLNEITLKELSDFAPTIFIHLAASFERSVESLDFWNNNFNDNVKLSHHLMGSLKELSSLHSVIFASSYLIYDQDLYMSNFSPIKPKQLKESDIAKPRNLVGMAKLAHEKELEFLSHFYGDNFRSLSVRIFRGYGRGSRDVISRWVRDLLVSKEISIYNPNGIFDFIYAKDTAKGILKLALESKLYGVVNLGTGTSHSINEVIAVLLKYFPKMKTKVMGLSLPVEASEADVSKFLKETNWLPEHSLEKAISEIIEYEKFKPINIIEKEKLNILITSSSSKAPLIRAIQKAVANKSHEVKVIAADSNKHAVSRYVADSFWEMPDLKSVSILEIIKFCEQAKIGLILPTRDGELEYWATNKNKLSDCGIEVLVSSLETVKKCLDKIHFYEFLSSIGYKSIPTVQDIDLLPQSEFYVVKERFGAGSNNIGVGLSFAQASNKSLSLVSPIFQPLVIGKEISADIWIIPNFYESVVLRYRVLVENGESKVTKVYRNALLEKSILDLANKLKIVGPAVIQAIIDDSGIAHIIECNPRIGGASTASNAAGSNSFSKMISYFLFNERVNTIGEQDRIRELTQVRTSSDEYFYDTHI
jgi:carbamoyl-phosphate synthase large subunit